MHEHDGSGRGRAGDDVVRQAREQFDDAIELLALTKDRLKRGEVAGVRDIASHTALVIKTLVALNEAKGRIDGLGDDEACEVGRALDLDAARSEVGRRLDRLRAAGGS